MYRRARSNVADVSCSSPCAKQEALQGGPRSSITPQTKNKAKVVGGGGEGAGEAEQTLLPTREKTTNLHAPR